MGWHTGRLPQKPPALGTAAGGQCGAVGVCTQWAALQAVAGWKEVGQEQPKGLQPRTAPFLLGSHPPGKQLLD